MSPCAPKVSLPLEAREIRMDVMNIRLVPPPASTTWIRLWAPLAVLLPPTGRPMAIHSSRAIWGTSPIPPPLATPPTLMDLVSRLWDQAATQKNLTAIVSTVSLVGLLALHPTMATIIAFDVHDPLSTSQ